MHSSMSFSFPLSSFLLLISCNGRWLKCWGATGMVWTSLVICTNTRLVHPTWLAHTIPVGVSFNVSMRPLLSMLFELSLVFAAFWPMIEMLGMRDTGMVPVSLVICTSTDIVHPTRLTDSIPVSVSNASIYEALFNVTFGRWLNCWGTTDMGTVWVSLVVCTKTNLVHPTWLAYPVPIYICAQCKYEAFFPPLFEFAAFGRWLWISFTIWIQVFSYFALLLYYTCSILLYIYEFAKLLFLYRWRGMSCSRVGFQESTSTGRTRIVRSTGSKATSTKGTPLGASPKGIGGGGTVDGWGLMPATSWSYRPWSPWLAIYSMSC